MPSEEEITFRKQNNMKVLSAKLLSKQVREDVFRLNALVRLVTDYTTKKQLKKLQALETDFKSALSDSSFDAIAHAWDETEPRTVKNLVRLSHKYKFDHTWLNDFFTQTKLGLQAGSFRTIDDSLAYVHGTAEVVGLMLARILGVDDTQRVARVLQTSDLKKHRRGNPSSKQRIVLRAKHALKRFQQPADKYVEQATQEIESIQKYVALQARALQWVKFVRDIKDNAATGHNYFPKQDLETCNLKDLSASTAEAQPDEVSKFIKLQLKHYRTWQVEASRLMRLMPKRLKVPLKTIISQSEAIASQIDENPLIVYERTVKPGKRRTLQQAASKHDTHK